MYRNDYFVFLLTTPHLENEIQYTKVDIETIKSTAHASDHFTLILGNELC